jgi:hypothetical protein
MGMGPLSNLSSTPSVPLRHKVEPVRAVSPTLAVGHNASHERYAGQKAKAQINARPRYNSHSAAPGFAAHILVEADLIGNDPFAGLRGTKAYQSNGKSHPNLLMVV